MGSGYPHLRGGYGNRHCFACGCGLNLLQGRAGAGYTWCGAGMGLEIICAGN